MVHGYFLILCKMAFNWRRAGTAAASFPVDFNGPSGNRVVGYVGHGRVSVAAPALTAATPASFSLTASSAGTFSSLIAGTAALPFAGPGVTRSGAIFVGHKITSFAANIVKSSDQSVPSCPGAFFSS
jgi:hypothetical protein